MKIGLLQADWVNAAHRAEHGDLCDIFASFFRSRGDIAMEVFPVFKGVLPEAGHRADAYLITGSRRSAYEDEPWIAAIRAFVVERHLRGDRLIGICFGHQVIAQGLGGEVARAAQGWNLGVHEMVFRQRRPWMQPVCERVRVIFNHRDQVVRLPVGATLLAGDDSCPVQAYELNGTVLSFQGHPEYSIAYQEALMSAASSPIDEAVRSAALAANRGPRPDNELMRDWIVNFALAGRELRCARGARGAR